MTQAILKAPSIYEIGRNRAVPLYGYAFEFEAHTARWSKVPRALLAAVGFALLAALLVVWPATPALDRARRALQLEPALVKDRTIDRSSALMATLQIALLAYALGSLIEFIEPGHLSFSNILILTVLAGFCAILALYPKTRHAAAGRSACEAATALPRRFLGRVLACLLVATLAWMAWRGAVVPVRCESCEPVEWLEGISAWPSHLLHLSALFTIAFGLDYSLSKSSMVFGEGARWMTSDGEGRPISVDLQSSLRWRYVSVVGWRNRRHACVNFVKLWRQYAVRGQNCPRALRVLIGLATMLVLAASLFLMFNEGHLPTVPARSQDHRDLFGWTLSLCVILLTALILVVADATLLSCRFIQYLNRARTSYPPEIVSSFSRSLGPEHQDLWTERIDADPVQRSLASTDESSPLPRSPQHTPLPSPHTPPPHTLLDDWIDVQIVAKLTSPIAPLIIWPAVVVALLVVARSRLFDNWSLSLPIAAAAAAYLLWLIVLAVLLKTLAEQTRRCAIERMEADLRWLRGSPPRYAGLEGQFEDLIASVRKISTGAFAGFFEQPLFRALLVPLGGAGGAQLIDYFLLARY